MQWYYQLHFGYALGNAIRDLLNKLFSDFRVDRIYNLALNDNTLSIGKTLVMFRNMPAQHEFDFITVSEYGKVDETKTLNVRNFFYNLRSIFAGSIKSSKSTKKSEHRIFISYRRVDTKWATGRLYDHLTQSGRFKTVIGTP